MASVREGGEKWGKIVCRSSFSFALFLGVEGWTNYGRTCGCETWVHRCHCWCVPAESDAYNKNSAITGQPPSVPSLGKVPHPGLPWPCLPTTKLHGKERTSPCLVKGQVVRGLLCCLPSYFSVVSFPGSLESVGAPGSMVTMLTTKAAGVHTTWERCRNSQPAHLLLRNEVLLNERWVFVGIGKTHTFLFLHSELPNKWIPS